MVLYYDGETTQRSAEFRYLGIILHETRGMSLVLLTHL
jgi:hypothetical protein